MINEGQAGFRSGMGVLDNMGAGWGSVLDTR